MGIAKKREIKSRFSPYLVYFVFRTAIVCLLVDFQPTTVGCDSICVSCFRKTILLGSDTFPSDTVHNLGVVFDSDFNFRQHISQVCKSCFYHIRDLRRIRRYISISTAKTISAALISSRLDYCNELLNNIAKRDLATLQRVQNCLARVVLRAPRFSPSLPLLKQLHWLPVSYRINSKLSTLTYRALSTQQPPYLASLLHLSNIPRQIIIFTTNYCT